MKLKMLVELEYNEIDMYGGDDDLEAKEWFFKDVLSNKNELILHSNELGDEVGFIKILEIYDEKIIS